MKQSKRAARARRKAKSMRCGTYHRTKFARGYWKASKAAKQMLAERVRLGHYRTIVP